MIKAVLDTNVTISGVIRHSGVSFTILEAWRNGLFLLITSPALIAEARKVFYYPKIINKYKLSREEIENVLQNFYYHSLVVPGKQKIQIVKEDPKDDQVIIAALDGEAQYIISGDVHLQKIKEYNGIKVASPKEFVRVLKLDFD